MWFEDPDQAARRAAGRSHGASYRVAGWSRLDLAAGGVFLTLAAAVFLSFLGFTNQHLTVVGIAAMSAGFAGIATAWTLRLGDLVRIDERGLRAARGRSGESSYAYRVGLESIDGFEIRTWFRDRDDASADRPARPYPWSRAAQSVSVRLVDGTYVEVFTRGAFWRHPVLIERRPGRRFWRPVATNGGRPLTWTAETDTEVAALFQQRLLDVRVAVAGIPATARRASTESAPLLVLRGFRVDVHRRTPPVRAGQRRWFSASVDRSDGPVPPPAPEPRAPELTALDVSAATAPTLAASDMTVPALGSLAIPTCYWTLAAERSGSLPGRRAAMAITSDGVQLDRTIGRPRIVPLARVDAFAPRFDATALAREAEGTLVQRGRWQLVLHLTDGSELPLTGLDHGYFAGNELRWLDGCTSRAANARPDGFMPWPNDQPLGIAARLNAHLDVARTAAGIPRATAA